MTGQRAKLADGGLPPWRYGVARLVPAGCYVGQDQ
jgi:hypothetical protein